MAASPRAPDLPKSVILTDVPLHPLSWKTKKELQKEDAYL